MRFAMAYSCGKDSSLALHKMIEEGHEPVCLITMFRQDQGRSWFHGADCDLLKAYGQALGIPIKICPCDGISYQQTFIDALKSARNSGAEICAFGDLDIEANRQWEETCCHEANLEARFPLWGRKRLDVVEEIIKSDFKCLIKDIDCRILPKNILGRHLDLETLAEILANGADPCGENGEYHTLTVDGPIFKTPIKYSVGDILQFGEHAAITIELVHE